MKSFLFTLAVVGMVSTTEAFDFSDVQEFVSTIPRTKKERLSRMKIPKSLHSSPEAKQAVIDKAHHHTLRAHKHREILGEKMGLAARTPYYELMSSGSGHHRLAAGEDEESLGIGGMMGAVIGIFNGLQFQNTGFNQCIGTVSGFMQSTENFGLLLSKCYQPWYWEDLVYNVEDFTATTGGIYEACETGKLFTTLSGLLSLEGAMELLSRATGSIFTYFEIGRTCGDPDSSSLDCGTILGKAVSNIIDYKV